MNFQLSLALLCLIVATVVAEPTTENEDIDVQSTGRGVASMARSFWDFFFGEAEDYDYGDYDQAFAPQGEISSYSFYNPNSARRESYALTEDEDEYSWGEFAFGAALAFVPIGLLLAAFPAGLFTVAVKKRSFSDDSMLSNIDPSVMPLVNALAKGDLFAIAKPHCQMKLFCELSQLGKSESASFVQKVFYYIANLAPENMAKRFRLMRLFDATRQNKCEIYSCQDNYKAPSNHVEVPANEKESS